jgi:ABC-type enterochelin transport system ATPase subunit
MQAYHNELVTKVTLLEQQNTQLKKEKVQDLIHVFPRFCFLFVEFFPR